VVVAGVWDVVLVADDMPRLAEDRLLFELEELGVVVDPGGEAGAVVGVD